MNADRLLDGFNLLGDEQETVQQLRKLIVALAVAGKLISTNETTDEATSLMKLIEDRKRALIQKGLLRKQNPSPKLRSTTCQWVFPARITLFGSVLLCV
jgi:type I restriction enzyme S subunit